mmetsp:Transcript_17893/g.36870  ORF Transcript_17893/g.36870 Transcript_17893/m.36870 type:complete len:250 (-) Transcript_17893:1470-2219(-)
MFCSGASHLLRLGSYAFIWQYHKSGNEAALTLSGRTRHFLQLSHCTHSSSLCSTSSNCSPCSSSSFSRRRFFLLFFPDSSRAASFSVSLASFAVSLAFCLTLSFSFASSAAFRPVRSEKGILTSSSGVGFCAVAMISSFDFFAEKALPFGPIFCCFGVTAAAGASTEWLLTLTFSSSGTGRGDLGLGLLARSPFFFFFFVSTTSSSATGGNSSSTADVSLEAASSGFAIAASMRFFPMTTLIRRFAGGS